MSIDLQGDQGPRPVKILCVTPFSWLYGEALSLLQLVQSLDRSRYSPSVITTGDGPLVDHLREAQVPVESIRMPFLSRRGKQAIDFALSVIPVSLRLSRLIQQEGYDLVYNNTLLNPYGALAAYLAGVPCVWHVREVGRGSRLRTGFLHLTAFLATRLVVVSESVSELYTEQEREKLRVVYNGIDPQQFDPALFDATRIRAKHGIAADQPVISMIGRLHPSKNHKDVLVAARPLLALWPDLQVLMVGDGPMEDELQQDISELGMEGNVRLMGYMEDVREVLAASDLVVMASEHEAFGRSVVEAMMMEKPVVATRVGGLPELISEETGLLVPVGCPEELGNAIQSILSNPNHAAELGRQGRERAISLFSIERHVDEMKAVFEELL